MKKKLILITLLMFFGCQKPCEVCEDCSWDNELSWALHVEGEECIYTDENDKCSEYFSTIEIEEGGETEFLHQSKRFKQEVGQTLIWPVGFTHQHRGNPVLQGEKVYITGWFHRSAIQSQREPRL